MDDPLFGDLNLGGDEADERVEPLVPLDVGRTRTDRRTGAEYVVRSMRPKDRPVAYGQAATIIVAWAAAVVEWVVGTPVPSVVVAASVSFVALVIGWVVQRRVQPFYDEGGDDDEALRAAVARYETAAEDVTMPVSEPGGDT